MSQFGGNLLRFRNRYERDSRFIERLGIDADRFNDFLAGALPTDNELNSMAARLNVRDFELFSGQIWPC